MTLTIRSVDISAVQMGTEDVFKTEHISVLFVKKTREKIKEILKFSVV